MLARSLFSPCAFAVAVALLATACAHRTRIITRPAGADVYLEDRFVCVTPCMLSTPKLRKHTRVRLTAEGYHPAEMELVTRVLPGRVIASIVTLGISAIFKWPYTYQSIHMADLQRLTLEDRLGEIRRMRDAGQLTDDEFEKLRIQVLGVP